MTSFPIYVLSKSRAGKALTCNHLEQAGMPYHLMVPPSQEKAYAARYPLANIFTTSKETQRMGEVRNDLLRYARIQGHPYIWMLDDDIVRLNVIQKGKIIQPSLAALHDLEPMISGLDIVQAGMTGAIPNPQRIHCSVNGPCCAVVAFNMQAMQEYSYDPQLYFGGDIDLTLQILTSGKYNVRFFSYSYVCKSFGKKGKEYPGGLEETYLTQTTEESFNRIVSKYPGIVRIGLDPGGRSMLIVNWAKFRVKVQR